MTYTEHCATALRVVKSVNPGRHGVCVYVAHNRDRCDFVIWTTLGGKIHDQVLDAANTSEERLEAHLRGFVDNVVGTYA